MPAKTTTYDAPPTAAEAELGHNSGKSISAQRLKQFISRIEKLEDERKNIGADIKEVFSAAKTAGFDTKIMRRVIALRRLEKADREEQEALLQVYWDAVNG